MQAVKVPAKGLIHSADAGEMQFRRSLKAKLRQILISPTYIRERVAALGRQIVREAARGGVEQLQFVVVLKGATVFAADLARAICAARGPGIRFNFIKASSYGAGTVSRGDVKIEGSLQYVRGRHLIVVEDIIDTGLTMARLKKYLLRERKAASVRICALLNKPSRRLPALRGALKIDYLGFEIPDFFVVGYGLDCGEQLRELPCVAVVNPQKLAP